MPVYFDHNATTPLDPMARDAMLPYLAADFGNPSSPHEYGRAARHAVEAAREKVAASVGAHPSEIVFTASGTEANNLFIKGAPGRGKPALIAVGAIEHSSVLVPAEQLRARGWTVCKIPVDASGRIDAGEFAKIAEVFPALVSIMLANNETGVLQDIEACAARLSKDGALFHTDAIQAFGKIPLNFAEMKAAGVHAMTVSAHKVGGPKGAAALVLDRRVLIEPLVGGGGHEAGLRSGTENVAAIVGFGRACENAVSRLSDHAEKWRKQRLRIEAGLLAQSARIFGLGAERLPNTVYFAVPGIDGGTLIACLDRAGFAVAGGSACSSGRAEPSHVLVAMGVEPALARGAVRISLGASNTDEEVERFLDALRTTLSKLNQLTAIAVNREEEAQC